MAARDAFWAYLLSGAMLVGLLYPASQDPKEVDSFPFSTYPMFSFRRQAPAIPHVIGYDRDRQRRRLPPEVVVANGEIMQAAVTVDRAVYQGPKATRALCLHVAARVAERRELAEVLVVSVITDVYDPVVYFMDGPTPIKSYRHQVCRVNR